MTIQVIKSNVNVKALKSVGSVVFTSPLQNLDDSKAILYAFNPKLFSPSEHSLAPPVCPIFLKSKLATNLYVGKKEVLKHFDP
jgi:hypothetical protein